MAKTIRRTADTTEREIRDARRASCERKRSTHESTVEFDLAYAAYAGAFATLSLTK